MKRKLREKIPITLNDQVKHPDLMWPTPSKGMWKQDVNDEGRYARGHQGEGFPGDAAGRGENPWEGWWTAEPEVGSNGSWDTQEGGQT